MAPIDSSKTRFLRGLSIRRCGRVDAGEDRGEDLPVTLRTAQAPRAGVVAGDPAAEEEDLSHGVFVGGNGGTEGEVAEGLEGVVELVEARIARGPPGVAPGEGLGGGGGEAEEPFGTWSRSR